MKNILLIGCGGHCKSVIDVIEQEGVYRIKGLVNSPDSNIQEVSGYPVIGSDFDLKDLSEEYTYAFIAVGQIYSPDLRISLFKNLKQLGFKLPKIISPLSYVSKSSSVSEGSIVMHHSIINANSFIGRNCIINSKALIEHDCIVNDFCHISTNVTINGGVNVGEKSFIGSGSTTKEGISIEDSSFIKAGSVVK